MRRSIIAGIFFAFGLSGWVAAEAQSPEGSPPPSYGPLSSTMPGGALENYEARTFRTHELTFGLTVSLAQLQAILPPGYTASVPRVTVRVTYQQRTEVTAAAGAVPQGTYGPHSVFDVFTTAVSPGGPEVLFLVSERSTQDDVDLVNALFGDGSARLADRLNIEINEDAEVLRFRVRVADDTLGLTMRVDADLPAAIATRSIGNPVSTPVRFLNGLSPNTRFRVADQQDFINVPTAGNLTVRAPGNVLRLPAGTLDIEGVEATMTVSRWRELFVKLVP